MWLPWRIFFTWQPGSINQQWRLDLHQQWPSCLNLTLLTEEEDKEISDKTGVLLNCKTSLLAPCQTPIFRLLATGLTSTSLPSFHAISSGNGVTGLWIAQESKRIFLHLKILTKQTHLEYQKNPQFYLVDFSIPVNLPWFWQLQRILTIPCVTQEQQIM
jgi:hypothetical protein